MFRILRLSAALFIGAIATLGIAAAPAHADTITVNGTFSIVNDRSGFALQPEALATMPRLQQKVSDRRDTQRFVITGSNGIHKVRQLFTNKCLDLPTDLPRPQQLEQAFLVMRDCDGTTTQQWRLFTHPNGVVQFENVLSLKAMDIQKGQGNAINAFAIQSSVFSVFMDFRLVA